MKNPIVVFFDRGRARDSGAFAWPVNIDFPIGWDANGMMKDQKQSECEYEVLLLDDCAPVPDSKHTNKDANQSLLVIAHSNSVINAEPESNGVLSSWGRPYVCRKFSHTPGDPVFERLKTLISGSLGASDFARTWRSTNHLEWYDRLAAVCQIRMIDPNAETDELWSKILDHLPDYFSKRLGNMDNEQCLKLIRQAAAPIAP